VKITLTKKRERLTADAVTAAQAQKSPFLFMDDLCLEYTERNELFYGATR
jgi:hypothetical protein